MNIWERYIKEAKIRIKKADVKRNEYRDLVVKYGNLVTKYQNLVSKLSERIHEDLWLIEEYEEKTNGN